MILFERLNCVIYTHTNGLYGLIRINSEILYFHKRKEKQSISLTAKNVMNISFFYKLSPLKTKMKNKIPSCLWFFFFYFSANTVIIEEAGKIKALLIHNEPIFYNGKALLSLNVS